MDTNTTPLTDHNALTGVVAIMESSLMRLEPQVKWILSGAAYERSAIRYDIESLKECLDTLKAMSER